ncbi:multiple sugar transport system permease protein [Georgenia satyanarayanai]|uniref:Multiple sugar transport system permease protein n=1 Tax=Georgenia satyanarayanai TaxID=860221 RepID=A0A2Y9C0X6_9MICO|nr:sugar ABC transporter permease [Georgenia satyanarayanai]PYF96320.1 multiple sugar transport system permease protein [Georgenia satyanarayanai]SSA47042.1 multiple sugar transport system permease protein [Georgenia satyanarayanai]
MTTAVTRRARARRPETLAGWAMVAPAAIGLLLFVLLPFVLAGWLSTQNVRLDTPQPPSWFGLEHYRRILLDPDFRGEFLTGLRNNLIFAAVVVPVQTSLALALAVLLNRPLRGMPVFRTFFFMPVVFPMALVAVVWKVIYTRGEQGLLNSVLDTVSFGLLPTQDWLGNPSTALAAIIIMSIWQGVGLQMVILLAGLQGIPGELYEAAALDKAGPWQRFRHVTLPGLRNTLIFVAMVTTILSFRVFDQVYIMTGGGPQDATTTVMYQAVTTAFTANNVGRASAITVLFFVIVLTITLIQRRVLREEREIA